MKTVIEGLEFIGKEKSSGYAKQYYLVRTKEGTYVQLTEMLYTVLTGLEKWEDLSQIAGELTSLRQKVFDTETVLYLIESKLEPLGLVIDSHNAAQQSTRQPLQPPSMLLGLRFKKTLLTVEQVQPVANVFTFLFWPPVLILAVIAIGILSGWLLLVHGIAGALSQAIDTPLLFFLLLGLIILSTLFHEIGHAAACVYGGGKPGKIGVGIYLVWPAFFTDLSDVYRLDRLAKLRSDIGGIYFNGIFCLLIAGLYFGTHYQPLLLVIVFQLIEILHQLLPFLRLDGYYIVADTIGIPDLFMKIAPVFKSILPGSKPPELKNMKLWARWLVIGWVGVTIPVLLYWLGTAILSMPFIIATTWQSAVDKTILLQKSIATADIGGAALGIFQIVALCIPVMGFGYAMYFVTKMTLQPLYTAPGTTGTKRLLLTGEVILFFLLFGIFIYLHSLK